MTKDTTMAHSTIHPFPRAVRGRPQPEHQWLALAGWLVLCQIVGIVAALGTDTSTAWYVTLEKPAWNPPSWVFAPMWTLLYVLMAVAAWLVWRTGRGGTALVLFLGQLALNFAWSFVFFDAQSIGWALVDITALWIAIAATIVAFWRVEPTAAWIMLSYLGWVTFAATLNAALFTLN
ncbi:MAG: TspO/MBR family protein [Vicinamibacterales bacterium]